MTDMNLPWFAHEWPAAEAKATILLAHGMGEHQFRYLPMIRFLNQQGYSVLTWDQPGHGQTAGDSLGRSPQGNCRADFTWRTQAVYEYATREPTQKVFALGHSMGGYTVLAWALSFQPQLAGLALSGIGLTPATKLHTLRAVMHLLAQLPKGNTPQGWLDRLTFTGFNRGFEAEQDQFSWVCSDETVRKAYHADPLCKVKLSPQYWSDFGSLLSTIRQQLHTLPATLPIWLAWGAADPAVKQGRWSRTLADKLKHQGSQVTTLDCQNQRHEIFNEADKQTTWTALSSWLDALQ